MEFSCEQCATRYSVPDERVRGKRVRTKCRKCGHEIVVEGPQVVAPEVAKASPEPVGATALAPRLATPPPPPPERETDDDATGPRSDEPWTVAISRTERRPMTTAEVVDAYAERTIGDKTLLWKEGMERWQPPFSVPAIALALGARGFAPGRNGKSEAPAAPQTRPPEAEAPGPASAPVPLSASAFNFDDEATAVIAPDRARELLEAEAAKKTEPPTPDPSETPLSFGFSDESTKVLEPERAEALLEKQNDGEPTATRTSSPPASPGPSVLPKAETPRGAEPSVVVADGLEATKSKVKAPAPTPPPAPPKLSVSRELVDEPTRVLRMKKQGAGTTFWLVLLLALAAAAAGGFVASQVLHDRHGPSWLKLP